MKVSDRLLGLVFMLLGTCVALYGTTLPPMPGQAYGAGLFPAGVGSLLACAGALLALSGWRRRDTEHLVERTEWLRSRRHVGNLLLTACLILAFAFFIRQIGFAVLAFAAVALLLARFGQPVWRSALAAAVAAGAFQLLFVNVMRVPLPAGLLERLLY